MPGVKTLDRIKAKEDLYDQAAEMSDKPERTIKMTKQASNELSQGYTGVKVPEHKPAVKTSDGPVKSFGKPWRPKGAK